jgi:hypothetical protein
MISVPVWLEELAAPCATVTEGKRDRVALGAAQHAPDDAHFF